MAKLADIVARYGAAGSCVYGSGEPEGERAARALRYWRKAGKPMAEALRLAMADETAGKSRWPSSLGAVAGAADERGGRWISKPESLGFRFVGFADEIAKRIGYRMDHTGWFMYENGEGDLARGAVYQLPARDGRPLYVPAYREGPGGRSGWHDMSGEHGAFMLLRDCELGERGEESPDSAAWKAASLGDSAAERAAERSREYDSAWQAGSSYASELETAREERRAFLALRAELKAGEAIELDSAGRPLTLAALESVLRGHCSGWRKAKAKALAIWRERPQYSKELESAFMEGAAI